MIVLCLLFVMQVYYGALVQKILDDYNLSISLGMWFVFFNAAILCSLQNNRKYQMVYGTNESSFLFLWKTLQKLL